MIIEEKSSNVLLVELYKYIASFQFGKETSKTADSESLIAGQLCVL